MPPLADQKSDILGKKYREIFLEKKYIYGRFCSTCVQMLLFGILINI